MKRRGAVLTLCVAITAIAACSRTRSSAPASRDEPGEALACLAPDGAAYSARGPLTGVWLAGDTHVHTDHSADGSGPRQRTQQRAPGNLSVADQISQAARTSLDFLALTDHRTYDQHWDPQYTTEQLLLVPGAEVNGAPHAIVLGTVDEIVDGANPSGAAPFRHLQQSLWDVHAQDALWSIAHSDNGYVDGQRGVNANASVMAPDLVEIWNIAGNPDAEIAFAEDRWNRGFHLGAVGASDNHERELWDIAGPGHPTTWVFATERSRRGILDGLRAGRTTIARDRKGPFLTLEADLGAGSFPIMMGEAVTARAGDTLRLRARVRNGAGSKVYLYRSPGRSAGPLASIDIDSTDASFIVTAQVGEGSQWYRAEVRSPGSPSGQDADLTLADQLRAATSPLFVSTVALPTPQPEIPLPARERRDDGATPVFAAAACDALSARTTRDFAGFADVARSDAFVHVVAETHRSARSGIEYRRGDASGTFEPAVTLTPRSSTAHAPRIVAAGASVWVVWQDERDGGHIYLRHSADSGRRWQREVRLSLPASGATQPALALIDASTPVVAWADHRDGAYDIRVLVVGVDREPVNLSAPGKQIVTGTVSDARAARFPASLFPAVAVTARGEIAVVWQDNRFDPDPLWTGHTPPAGEAESGGTDPDDYEILVSTRTAAGGWSAPARISNDAAGSDRRPSIVAHRDGYVVAWDTRALRRAGVNTAIRASRSTDGRVWSPAVEVSQAPTAMSLRPRLTLDGDASVRAVWYDSRGADWRWQLFTTRLTAAGWSEPAPLTSNGNALWPALARDIVVFTTDRRATQEQRRVRQEVFVLPIVPIASSPRAAMMPSASALSLPR